MTGIEVWKYIKGYEGVYQVSNCGCVRSLDRESLVESVHGPYVRKHKGRVLSANDNGKGYLSVQLTRGNRRYVHRLVAEHFIKHVEGKTDINHIDNDTGNNYAGNLEWCTQSENISHAVSQGRQCKGESRWNSKLTEQDVINIRGLLIEGKLTQREIAGLHGVRAATISDINRGATWKHVA